MCNLNKIKFHKIFNKIKIINLFKKILIQVINCKIINY